MDGAIYLLTRKVDGDQGESFNQSVAVYAPGPKEAKDLVQQEFSRLRKASKSPERPYQDTPTFEVDQIDLDTYKLLTHWITV
jgi:hypothetical protein